MCILMSDDVEKRKELEQIIKRIAESEEQRLQNLKKEVDFYEEGLKKLKDIDQKSIVGTSS